MKKEYKLSLIAVFIVALSTFLYVWNTKHSMRSSCIPYIEKMKRIFENEIESTSSRHRQLYQKFRSGNLSTEDQELFLRISAKYQSDVLPAKTDIDSVLFEMEMDEKCKDKSLLMKGEVLRDKYSLLSNPESIDLQSLEEVEKQLSELK